VQFLQHGAWGFVWRYRQFSRAARGVDHAREKLGYVAVKCVEISEYARQTIQQVYSEARAQRMGTGNPNVVALYDVLVAADDLVALIMEEVEGGRTLGNELREALQEGRSFPAIQIVTWTEEIANGLQAFHAPKDKRSKRLAHRDVAPENVFLTPEKKVKVGDMGIATVVSESGLANTEPTPAAGRTLRMAPEQHYGPGEWGTAVDYWALGLIVFELATGTPLEHFCAERVPQLTPSAEYSRAIGEAVRRQARQHPSMHPELRELITSLVIDDPRVRGGMSRIQEARRRIEAHRPEEPTASEDDRVMRNPQPFAPPPEKPGWLSASERSALEADLAAPPPHRSDGAFERLVGRSRARRHTLDGRGRR
jgi:serine/threonine protein kinase